jgi:hypothetical protein
MKKRLYFLLIILECFGSAVAGDHFAGLSSNLFLQAELTPRASALGGAYSAIGNDVYAMFYNPAALANMQKSQVGFNRVQWFQDIRMHNLSAGFKIDSRFFTAASFSYLGMPAIQGKDRYGQNTESLNVNSSILQMSMAYKLHPSFFIGFGVKYFRDNLAGYLASGFAFDFGLYMETMIPHLSLAASVRNLGNKIRYNEASEPIPLNYSVGLGYILPQWHLRLDLDGVHSLDQGWLLKTGIEFDFMRRAFLRMGNAWFSANGLQPSFGFGARPIKNLSIDYTVFNHQNLGLTHRVGITFSFSLRKKTGHTSVQRQSLIQPPQRVYGYLKNDRIKLEWSDVPGAAYNVYARKSTDSQWKKANPSLLWAHETTIAKPHKPVSIDFAVTSVINGKESTFSRIVTVEIK